jgi:pyruvate formate lyase activating enzyme
MIVVCLPIELFSGPYLCKKNNIHTAIDTAGAHLSDDVINALTAADLLIIDLKHSDQEGYRALTGGNLKNVLRMIEWAQWQGKPLWVRQVAIPGITLDEQQLHRLGDLLEPISVIERIELLPYHRMGEDKYRELGLRPPLADTPAADPDLVAAHAEQLRQRGLPVFSPGKPAALSAATTAQKAESTLT